MRRFSTVVLCCLGVAAIGAGSALADSSNGSNGNGTPSASQVASQQCVAQLHAMGAKAFKAFYGKNAMQKCKGKQNGPASSTINNAAQQCNAEQADPNFAASHGGMTFDQFYGTNPNDRNSFGKCVSSKVQAAEAQQQANLLNAAQACRAERSDPGFAAAHGGKSFTDFYGTNINHRNAFGKCVSQKAQAQGNTPPPTP
jgi:hypothetical protein